MGEDTTAVGRAPLDVTIAAVGRFGGPTEFGWHTIEPMFRCWREYHLAKLHPEEGRSQGSSMALAVGTIVHEFLAAHYTPRLVQRENFAPSNGATPEALYQHLSENGYAEEAAEAWRLFDYYKLRYNGQDTYTGEDAKILNIEHEVRRALPNGRPYSVRADLVVELPDGVWVVDHKTAARASVEFVEGWQVEPSILGLFWAFQSVYGDRLRGVSINGIVKTTAPKFTRNMYCVDQRMIDDWIRMVSYRTGEEGMAQNSGWPVNFSACFRKMGSFVGKCRYFERCIYHLDETPWAVNGGTGG